MKFTRDHLYKALKGKVHVSHSVESNSVTPWTVAPQASLPMGFPK